jgi:hypothetical protein
MADFLSVAGIILRVVDGSAVERETIYQGERLRGALGNLISMEAESTGMRVLDCQVDLYEFAEEAALRAACPRGVAVTIAASWAGVSFQGVVDLKDITAEVGVLAVGEDFFKVVALHIEQAE